MKGKISEILLFLILFSLILGSFFLFDYWLNIDSPNDRKTEQSNKIEDEQGVVQLESGESLEEEIDIPKSLDLNIPFICQAPLLDWEPPFDHACEEAVVLMVHYYYQDSESTNLFKANEEIREIVDFEKKTYDFYEDSSAEQVAQLVRDYYGYKTEVIYNISLENIKEEIVKGYPVIVPTAGRLLENPYFTPPGPLYHMLLIKGYTKDVFIVNDPGTKHGKDYVYSYPILEKSIHDWDGEGDVTDGTSAMIVIKNEK
jgi:hypothetical protein